MFSLDVLKDNFESKQETKKDIVDRLYPEYIFSIDYALPQGWLNSVTHELRTRYTQRQIIDSFVWGYAKQESDPLGQPLPVNKRGFEILTLIKWGGEV